MPHWSNYHSHTSYSDGKGMPIDYVLQAIDLGMKSIGISEHAPVPFYSFWNMPAANIEAYFTDINLLKVKYANEIEIYCGLEIDYIQQEFENIKKTAQPEKLDYTIGSIHFLGKKKNGEYWNTDGAEEEFEIGAREVFGNDGHNMVKGYFAAINEMIEALKPTIIGHIDKFRMHNYNNKFFEESSDYYHRYLTQTLELAKENDCIIEFNTRGLYKHPNKMPYPSLWALRKIKDMGIMITINSDSHSANEIINEFTIASELLKEVGIYNQWQLQKGIWVETEIL
jgi:histidinol-phosphatase (PHP family)